MILPKQKSSHLINTGREKLKFGVDDNFKMTSFLNFKFFESYKIITRDKSSQI